jgi:hypothetical protein
MQTPQRMPWVVWPGLSSRRFFGSLFPSLIAFFALAAPLSAATPRTELLRLVPEDVGFCLVIEDLREHGTALVNSPFVKQVLTSTVGSKVIHAEEAQKLSFIDKFLEGTFHLTASQLRDEILGDALVLAYRPGPAQQPDQEEGLFLIRARNPKLLAELVDRLNEIQKATGDLEILEERAYHGLKYYRRAEKKGANYYYLHGPVLAVTNQEAMLQQVLELDQKTLAVEEPPVARHLRLLGADKPLAALWVNPRAFEKALEQKAATAAGAEATSLKTLLVYWKALDGIALSVTLQQDFGLTLAVRARLEQLPAPARKFLSTAAQPSELWDCVPKNAMLAMAGRTDVAALVEVFSQFMTEDARNSVQGVVQRSLGVIYGKDILKEILPQLGPDWVLYAVAPGAEEKSWFPHCLGAIRLRPGAGEVPTTVVVSNSLNSLATMGLFNLNGGHPGPFTLNCAMQDKIEVKYLVNEEQFPPGLQPACALKDGCLVLASAPAAIREFRPAAKHSAMPQNATVPLLRLSVREVVQFIKERREAIAASVAKKNHLDAEAVAEGMTNVLTVLDFFDAVEISQRCDLGRVILSLRVRTTLPLK